MTTTLRKSSSQRIIDHSEDNRSNRSKLSKNEDLEDIYEDPSTRPSYIDTYREPITKLPTLKRRKSCNTDISSDTNSDLKLGPIEAIDDDVLLWRKFIKWNWQYL
jgi:hypothetical protein